MKTTKTDQVTWIHIAHPTKEDVAVLGEQINLHPIVLEEFSTPTLRPRAVQYPEGIFLTVHIPLYNIEERTTYSAELDIIITPTHIVTGYRTEIYQLNELFESLNKDEKLRAHHMSKTPAHLLYLILDTLINSCFGRLAHITRNIDSIEDGVFHDDEREMVREISVVKRDILNFRRIVMPQRAILESLLQKDERFIPKELRPYWQDVIGTNTRIWNTLESQKETIESLEDTNNTLLSHKLNERMKFIAIFSVIMLPSTFYANLLGINTPIPLGHNLNGFWMHTGVIFVLAIITVISFRKLKWI